MNLDNMSVTPMTSTAAAPTEVTLVDMKVLSDSLNIIIQSLNIASKHGAYTLDDAYKSKIAFDNVVESFTTLNKLQQYVSKKSQDGASSDDSAPSTNSLETTDATQKKRVSV